MVDQASRLIEEIQQIKAQYVAEVGKGRRVWPRSIKERAAKLDEMGVPAKALAKQTEISYETLILWRYNRRHARPEARFHEVKVEVPKALPAPTAMAKARDWRSPGYKLSDGRHILRRLFTNLRRQMGGTYAGHCTVRVVFFEKHSPGD